MSRQFLDNLLGRSDSLKPVRQAIGIHRQGNGNLSISIFSEYADGQRGQSNIGMNFAALQEASAFAAEQAAVLGIGRVVVLPSAA